MGILRERWEQLKGLDLERHLGLRPEYPKTAIEIDGDDLTLVHTRVKGRTLPMLEQVCTAELPRAAPTTINDLELASNEALGASFAELFQKSGLRPGKLSLVLPDNVAKISLLELPERPPSKRQLEELIRFKTRRGAPFRLSEASMSYQILPGEGKGIQVLVAMVRRGLVERYESALESVGARPGLIDLCTPNLINLFRPRLEELAEQGDIALLNCAGSYFTMVIIRRGRLVFFRCKTYSMSGGTAASVETLRREMTYSRSYYEERLGGDGIRHLLVRRGHRDGGELEQPLAALGAESIEWVDPTKIASAGQPGGWTSELAQRVAPALGAVLGEGLSVQIVDLNLASRQFKNETLPWVMFVLAVVVVGLFSWWNVSTYATARSEMAALLEREDNIKRRLGDLRARQARAFSQIDRSDLDTVLLRTEKANEVIRWKSFSWTRLFNVLQEVQPHNVQMLSINPVFHGKTSNKRSRDGIDPELVPISVEGVCKNLFDFFEFQGNLLNDSRINSVEPDSWSTDEATGETLFSMRFLYDPRVDANVLREAAEEATVAAVDGSAAEDALEAAAEPGAADVEGDPVVAMDSPPVEPPVVASEKNSLAAGPQKKIRRKRAGARRADAKDPAPLPAGALDGAPKTVEEFGEPRSDSDDAAAAASDGGRS